MLPAIFADERRTKHEAQRTKDNWYSKGLICKSLNVICKAENQNLRQLFVELEVPLPETTKGEGFGASNKSYMLIPQVSTL
jgi:hypothetical protein